MNKHSRKFQNIYTIDSEPCKQEKRFMAGLGFVVCRIAFFYNKSPEPLGFFPKGDDVPW